MKGNEVTTVQGQYWQFPTGDYVLITGSGYAEMLRMRRAVTKLLDDRTKYNQAYERCDNTGEE